MCAKVSLKSSSMQVVIDRRTIGGLTGSRVAGVFGRVPEESIVAERRNLWK